MRKNQYLKTDNIFLDSSVFEENNFLDGTRIHTLLSYAKSGVIKLHVTTISKLELLNRVDKRIREGKTELKKLNRKFNDKNTRVIKNLGLYKNLQIPEINLSQHTRELKNKIEAAFKRANVNTIRTQNISLTELVKQYYHRDPPFHNSGKQNEFIDAFILKALEKWCIGNKTKMYVLSNDKDFLGYESDYLIITNDLSEILVKITRYYNKRYKTNQITKTRQIIKKNKDALEQLASQIIADKINVRGGNVDISQFSILHTKLKSYNIISINKGITEIECNFSASLSFYVFEESDFSEQNPKSVVNDILVPLYSEIRNGRIDIKQRVESPDYIYEVT
jgi:PIN domain-containing protein